MTKRAQAFDAAMAAFQSAELRKCTMCKQCLPLVAFGKDSSRRDKTAARCKPCNRLHAKGKTTAYKKPVRNPDATPGQLINRMAGKYVPPRNEYVRNDGNKHIKSLGF